jgi:hypothetical protein
MGEVSERPGPDGDAAHPRVEGLAVDLAARPALPDRSSVECFSQIKPS